MNCGVLSLPRSSLATKDDPLLLRQVVYITECSLQIAMQGRECFACAPTGSGKTLAFALPILMKLKVISAASFLTFSGPHCISQYFPSFVFIS